MISCCSWQASFSYMTRCPPLLTKDYKSEQLSDCVTFLIGWVEAPVTRVFH